MAMKMEDEVKHMAEVLNIKIEVSKDVTVNEVKETMEITEKIKRVIEESFGKEASVDVAIKDHAEDSLVPFPDPLPSLKNTTADVIKVDYSNLLTGDYDDIAEPDSDHDLLELEELTDVPSEDKREETDEKLKLFAKEIKKVKNLQLPSSSNSIFEVEIRKTFEQLLPSQVLDTLTSTRCGLCHEDFTSERYAWKHYTGYNHKRTVKYFINGTYKDHPSFYNMVLDAVHANHPSGVTESHILDFIKKEHPVGDNDTRSINLIRQRGLARLLQIEYVNCKDGIFTATPALLNRKKRSKQLQEKTESVKVESVDKMVEKENAKSINTDYQIFKDQIFDFSKKDLPKSIIDTLTPEHCGLCYLQIYCKPWSHYTGAGHRTTVEIYQSGSYLGHPPYHTMLEKYVSEVKPTNLNEKDIVAYVRKNFNVGDDTEKVKDRVEMCLSLWKKKKGSPINKSKVSSETKKVSQPSKLKFPSDNLVWFKKNSAEEKHKKSVGSDNKSNAKKLKCEPNSSSRVKETNISNRKESRSSRSYQSPVPKACSSKRKSSPIDLKRDVRANGSSFKRGQDVLNTGHSRVSSGRYESDCKNNSRTSENYRRSAEKWERSPDRKRRSTGQESRSPRRPRSPESRKRTPDDRHRRSPRRKERSPEKPNSSHQTGDNHKRYRKDSGLKIEARREKINSHHNDLQRRNSSNSSRSYSDLSPRVKVDTATRSSLNSSSKGSHFSGKSVSSSKSPNNAEQHSRPSSNSSRSQRPVKAASNSSSLPRPNSRDSLSNLTNPSPPPGVFPPDFFQAAQNPAMQPPVTQPQLPFPGSFLTQHPQFPYVFILNSLGGQMGGHMGGQMSGQMMMQQPLPTMGQMQHPLPNQPPL